MALALEVGDHIVKAWLVLDYPGMIVNDMLWEAGRVARRVRSHSLGDLIIGVEGCGADSHADGLSCSGILSDLDRVCLVMGAIRSSGWELSTNNVLPSLSSCRYLYMVYSCRHGSPTVGGG